MTVANRYSYPSQVPMYVMSPHQRLLTFAASAVKSRRILSARAAAAGSAMVVFFHRFAARPRKPLARMMASDSYSYGHGQSSAGVSIEFGT